DRLPSGNTSGLVFTGISTHARLLPYLEQKNVYDLVDFNVGYSDPANDAAEAVTLPGFRCPSDQDKLPANLGGRNNYYVNAGTNLTFAGVRPTDPADPNYNKPVANGLFYRDSYLRMAHATDGTSNTVAFGERRTGDGSNGVSSETDTFQPGTYPATPDQALADCRAVDVTDLSKQGVSNVGAPWLWAYHSTTIYWHVAPPNERSCMYPPGRIMTTAGSEHTGGVQVTLLDGSVRFVSDTVDLSVWRAVGTRNGGETVTEF
ncbi:MAG TPA: DUF1559 domain-containing protein, partial [Planctomycetaceae bacterium]